MGIPSFYRWLVQRYPLVVTDAIEEPSNSVNGVHVYPDSSRPNPNGLEFDNLYLDMNGIIHPCFHPEGLPAPKTYDEVFKAVFGYIDKLFSIVRPRKLLYMAIDGVAPRAKMNQQRTRRFRAAKEAAGEGSGTENGRGIFKSESEKLDSMPLDSNIITPGTKFMALLSTALIYYVHLRMNEDPGWQGVKVIISDSSVPGEGEHKIMSYIRLQRNLPGFDPNTRHCLYGLDADLIMLALATHEIHFSILREEVVHTKKTKTFMNLDDFILRQKFQFLNIWVLRSYLAHELRIPDSTVETDLERLIDDFVFMCLFVGNDFLPHVPSLDIQEGAIDLLMIIYKKEFVHMGGYLTNSSEVNLKRVEHFVQAAGSHENAIFNKRLQVNKKNEAQSRRYVAKVQRRRGSIQGHSSQSTVNESKDSMVPMSDAGKSEIDKVKLGEVGWKERYYTEKFEVKTDDERQRTQRDLVLKYIEGICWVMHYYYQGVCSWQWFYPYHFAPFASDFCGIYQLEIKFTLGEPFKPLDQLMAVLPTASAEALPLLYSKLMTDPSSPILDYYPIDFELDLNGKHLAWQAVCKLPFINESRLLSEIAKVEPMLTDEEKKRNRSGLDMLFLHISHPLAAKILSFLEQNKDNPKLPCAKLKNKIDHEFSGGMNGYICISDKPVNPVEIPSPVDGMETITKNKVISVLYEFPSFHPHIPKPPEGVRMPAEFVNENDLQPPPVMWHIPTLFGHELTQRPIPKLSIIGSELASSTGQLIITYYLGKGETKAGLLGSHTQHMKNKEAQEELVRAIRNLVCRPKKVKDKDSENLIDGALIDGGDGGSEKRVDGGDGGSEKRVDGGDGGSENRFSGGAITTSNKKRKKNCRKSQNGAAHLEVQLAPELPGSGSKNHMDGESKKKKGKMLRKSGDEVVAQEVQKSPNQLPVGNENCIDGESKRINRKRLGNTGDEVVTQEVQNSPKQLHVGNENHIDAESKSLKRRLRNSGDEVVTQEVQNSPKQLPVCNENHIDGESKSLERKRANRLRQRLQKRLRKSGYEVVTQEVQDSPKQLPVVNENHIDGGSRKRKRKYREMRHKLGKEEVPLGGGQVTQKPVNAGSENQVEDVLLGQEAQKPVNAGSENQTDGRAKESKPMQNFKIKSELLPGLSSSSGSCTGSGPMTRLRYSHLVQIGMMEDK